MVWGRQPLDGAINSCAHISGCPRTCFLRSGFREPSGRKLRMGKACSSLARSCRGLLRVEDTEALELALHHD